MSDEIRDNSLISGNLKSSFSNQSNNCKFSHDRVFFHSVQDCYSSDLDITCKYQLDKDITPHVNDYIGLFSVGSQGCSECLTRVPCAMESLAGAKFCKVVFRAKCLPKGNLRFYQFVYKTEDHETRGTSTAFKLGHGMDAFSIEHDFVEVSYCTCDLDKSEYENRIRVLEEEKQELQDKVAYFESETWRSRRKLVNLYEENHALRKALEESKRLWFAVEGCSHLTLQGLESVKKIENELSAGIEDLVACNTQVKLHASSFKAVIKQMEEKWNNRKKNNDDKVKGYTTVMPTKSASSSSSVNLKSVNVDGHMKSSDASVVVSQSSSHREETYTSLQSNSSASIPSSVNCVIGDVTLSEADTTELKGEHVRCDNLFVDGFVTGAADTSCTSSVLSVS